MDVSIRLSLCKEAGAVISISKAVIIPLQVTASTANNLNTDLFFPLLWETPTGNYLRNRKPLSSAEISWLYLHIIQITVFITWTACAKCLSKGLFYWLKLCFVQRTCPSRSKIRCVYGPLYHVQYKSKRSSNDGGSAPRPWQEQMWMKHPYEQGYFQTFSCKKCLLLTSWLYNHKSSTSLHFKPLSRITCLTDKRN